MTWILSYFTIQKLSGENNLNINEWGSSNDKDSAVLSVSHTWSLQHSKASCYFQTVAELRLSAHNLCPSKPLPLAKIKTDANAHTYVFTARSYTVRNLGFKCPHLTPITAMNCVCVNCYVHPLQGTCLVSRLHSNMQLRKKTLKMQPLYHCNFSTDLPCYETVTLTDLLFYETVTLTDLLFYEKYQTVTLTDLLFYETVTLTLICYFMRQ